MCHDRQNKNWPMCHLINHENLIPQILSVSQCNSTSTVLPKLSFDLCSETFNWVLKEIIESDTHITAVPIYDMGHTG